MKSLHLRVAASALALLLPLRVAAQTAEPAPAAPGPGVTVRVEAPACTRVPFDRARLFELLRVELRPLGVTEVAGEDAQAKSAQSAPVVAHAPVEPSPRVERGGSERPRVWTVDGAAMVRLFPARSTAIAGGALGASRTVAAGVRLRASVEAAFGDAHVRMGRVAVNAVTGSLGVGFFTAGPVELEVEPHVVLGAGWATGHADDTETVASHTYTDFLGIGAVSGTVRAAAERLSPFATLELGYAFHGVSFLADEERAAGLASVVFGARVGCGWAP